MKRIATIGLACVLAGCGMQVSETKSRLKGIGMPFAADNYGDSPSALRDALDDWYRVPNQPERLWGTPQVVPAEGGARLPPGSLVRVDIEQRPSRCAPREEGIRHAAWILASAPPGTPAFMDVGPAWLGNFVRLAGVGGVVEFPEPAGRGCDETLPQSGAVFDTIARRVFRVQDGFHLRPGRPFTVRVLEACPAAPSVEEQTVTTHHVPFYRGFGPTIPSTVVRERTWMRVKGQCRDGLHWFLFGPVTTDSPLDPQSNPAPMLTSGVEAGR